MMTPVEMVQFFTGRATSSAKALLAAQASGNFDLALLNARQLFKARLMCALLRWRLGDDPRSDAEEAISNLAAGRSVLRQLSPDTAVDPMIPLEKALIIATLLDKPIDVPPGASASSDSEAYERKLDWLLAYAVRGQIPEGAALGSAMAELSGRKRCRLAAETYQAYFAILRGKSDGATLDPLVAGAEALYKQRARDSFYSGGEQTDGGGPDNPHVVDYRLAAVLKKVGYRGESIHRWRW
jgi:hypothetical protein